MTMKCKSKKLMDSREKAFIVYKIYSHHIKPIQRLAACSLTK